MAQQTDISKMETTQADDNKMKSTETVTNGHTLKLNEIFVKIHANYER